MLGKYWVPNREFLVSAMKTSLLRNAMEEGFDIVMDNMNLNPKEVDSIKTKVDTYNRLSDTGFTYEIEFKDFFIPVDECIRRDAMRLNPIGEKIIRETWNRYKHFIQTKSVKRYVNSRLIQKPQCKAIVLDMDSTLCFNVTGRPWFGEGSSEGMLKDEPNMAIVNLSKAYSDYGYHVFIITGRDTSNKEVTEQWLGKYKVHYDKVFYREQHDYRKSAEVKKEIISNLLKDYNIELIIDDAEPVVEMYREMGLTALQPNKTI